MEESEMKLTTLCYIEKDDAMLMLHRVKKDHDVNKGKWIGVGGKFEAGESPDDCLLREVREETGLTLTHWRYRGIITFCYTCICLWRIHGQHRNCGSYCGYPCFW